MAARSKSKSPAPKSWKIGVMADTHDHWPEQIWSIFEGVDEIWHLGDFCGPDGLIELKARCGRVLCVLGNNDYEIREPLTRTVERGGERFHLIHILPRHAPPDVDWLLHGHSHRPWDAMQGKVRLFNPGTAGRSRGWPLSVGLLTKVGEKPFEAKIIRLADGAVVTPG